MRRILWSAGVGVLLLGASCKTDPPTPIDETCKDFTARHLAATPRIFTKRPSHIPIEARFDAKGSVRAVYGDFDAIGESIELAAQDFLHSELEALRLPPSVRFVNPITKQGKAGTYVRFESTYRGKKVYQGQAIVQLRKGEGESLQIRRLTLRTPSGLSLGEFEASMSEAEAADLARETLGVELLSDIPRVEAVAVPDEAGGYWAYRVLVPSETPRGEFEVLIDATSREIKSIQDTLRYVDGTGLVFDPNPIASTGNTTFVDSGDATNAALDAARVSVTLQELDGSGFLRGPFADVSNNSSRAQDATTFTFNFTRNDDRFEEVMAYFHIDRTQRYIQETLGFTDINNRRQVLNANAISDDNSFYSPTTLEISFGTGGVDDAEDADIIVHEYGHSIQDNQGMGGGGDEGAMGEGFGDYLAATVSGALTTQVANIACVGDWDTKPCLRRTDGIEHFPEGIHNQVHDDGELWSGLLFEIRAALGAEIADSLVLESQFAVGVSATFTEATLALLDADDDLFFGQHRETIRLLGVHRGFLRTLETPLPEGEILESQPLSISPCAGACGDDFDDTQVVNVPGATALSVHFSAFSTEEDANCFGGVCDNVYLYDAVGNLYDILGGNLGAFDSVVIPGDTIQVRFVSDFSVGSTGYTIDRVDVIGPCQ